MKSAFTCARSSGVVARRMVNGGEEGVDKALGVIGGCGGGGGSCGSVSMIRYFFSF